MIDNPDIGVACNDAGKAGFMQRGDYWELGDGRMVE